VWTPAEGFCEKTAYHIHVSFSGNVERRSNDGLPFVAGLLPIIAAQGLKCGVAGYANYRVEKRRPRNRSRGAFVFLALALGAGAAWMAWNRDRPVRSPMAALPPPAAGLQTNLIQSAPATRPEISPANVPAKEITNEFRQARTATNLPVPTSTTVLEAQVALDRLAISPGSIDGLLGSQTRAAVRAFQVQQGLPVTGELDAVTRAQLPLLSASVATCRVEPPDLARLLPLANTWLGKSEQPRLDYETVLEVLAERSHAHPNLLRRLNPAFDWNAVSPGTVINVPATGRIPPEAKAALVRIRLRERTLQAFDAASRLLAHFPCSIAARLEKRPVGELRVIVVVPNPDYMFNPDNFPESAEARELGRKLRLSPGPNNPVGTAWIGLNLSGYGIHGTPRPEDVGRTESHGCFRLANWNAEYLAQLVGVGTPVQIEP
jgi:lipoprotein-anchoring transpeptidase ErfK/SrfK